MGSVGICDGAPFLVLLSCKIVIFDSLTGFGVLRTIWAHHKALYETIFAMDNIYQLQMSSYFDSHMSNRAHIVTCRTIIRHVIGARVR